MKTKRLPFFSALLLCATFLPNIALAGDPYVECVQGQLERLGHDPGPIDGLMGPKTRASWRSAKEEIGESEALRELPDLRPSSAIHWCRELAKHDFRLGTFLPSRKGPLFEITPEDQELRFKYMWFHARDFFKLAYRIELAGQVGIVGSNNDAAIARGLGRLDTPLNLRVTGYTKQSRNRCTESDKLSGAAYPDRMILCVPDNLIGSSEKTRNDLIWRVGPVMVHEYAHLIQSELSGYRVTPRATRNGKSLMGPAWLYEGAAVVLAHEFQYRLLSPKSELTQWYQNKSRSETASLNSLRNDDEFVRAGAYLNAAFAVHLLTERVGRDSIFEFWRQIGYGKTWEEAFSETYNIELIDFERKFDAMRYDVTAVLVFAAGEQNRQ